MNVFKSDRANGLSFVLKSWVLSILCMAVFILIVYFYGDAIGLDFRSGVIFGVLCISVGHLIDLCREERVNEILIDTDKQKLLVRYYDFNEGQTSRVFEFKELRVSINRPAFFNKTSISSISLIKGRRAVFEVRKWKDGYSKDTLARLAQYLESLTSTVKK